MKKTVFTNSSQTRVAGTIGAVRVGLLIGGIIIDNIPYEYAFSINSILFALLTIFMVKKFYHYSIDKKIMTDEVYN